MLDLVDASSDPFQRNFHQVAIPKPERRLPPRPDSLWAETSVSMNFGMQSVKNAHVPVKIKSPGNRVVPWERNEMVLATPKIISLVDESWTVLPFTLVAIRSA